MSSREGRWAADCGDIVFGLQGAAGRGRRSGRCPGKTVEYGAPPQLPDHTGRVDARIGHFLVGGPQIGLSGVPGVDPTAESAKDFEPCPLALI